MSAEAESVEDDSPPTRTAVIQETNGSKRITIPAAVVDELDLSGGDSVFVRPDGEDGFQVRKASSVWRRD